MLSAQQLGDDAVNAGNGIIRSLHAKRVFSGDPIFDLEKTRSVAAESIPDQVGVFVPPHAWRCM